jgi:hypothetical protein
MARRSRVILCKTRAAAFGRVYAASMDEWNPMLAQRFDDAPDRRTELLERVSAVIIGLIICIGLLGWALSV